MSITVRDAYDYLKSADMSADITGSWMYLSHVNGCSFSVGWTGTMTGVLHVEVANGYSNFDTFSFSPSRYHSILSIQITAGTQPDSTTKWLADVIQTSAKGIRLHYIHTSGSGSLSADFYSKSMG